METARRRRLLPRLLRSKEAAPRHLPPRIDARPDQRRQGAARVDLDHIAEEHSSQHRCRSRIWTEEIIIDKGLVTNYNPDDLQTTLREDRRGVHRGPPRRTAPQPQEQGTLSWKHGPPAPERGRARRMGADRFHGALDLERRDKIRAGHRPRQLYSDVNRKTVQFNQLKGNTGVRMEQKRIDPQSGEEVAYDEIVKGFEITSDRYLVIEPCELGHSSRRRPSDRDQGLRDRPTSTRSSTTALTTWRRATAGADRTRCWSRRCRRPAASRSPRSSSARRSRSWHCARGR